MTIGVDLGGTHIRAGIDQRGQISKPKKEVFRTRGSLSQTLDQFTEFIRPLVSSGGKRIGIGVPSVVDVEKGIVITLLIFHVDRGTVKRNSGRGFKIPVRGE